MPYDSPQDSGVAAPEKSVAAVQSVDRALLVLEIVGRLGTAGVTEIAVELGVHKSTVSRLVTVLESRGFVEQVSGRGKYRLGFAVVRLAGSASAQLDLARESQAICDRLSRSSGETVNVAILDADRIVNVVESNGPGEIALRTWVGQNCPAHATSSGKALLAALRPAQRRALYGDGPLTTYTSRTVGDVAALEHMLAEVRATGWATVREELEVGLNAVSAPIRGADTEVVAALSISGPSYRMTTESMDTLAPLTVVAAGEISRRLGFTG